MMSLMVKNFFRVIEMTFLYGADDLKGQIYLCLFGHQTANTKGIGPDLPVKWAVLSLVFFSATGELFCTSSFLGANVSVVLGKRFERFPIS